MNDTIGVAISTTGQPARLRFLESCIGAWKAVLPLGSVIVVTVDGDEDEARAAYETCRPSLASGGVVIRAGRPLKEREGRVGVAANKNTGIEFLMDAGVEHLFLCDDDTWPRMRGAIDKHIGLATEHGIMHSLVCWGEHRLVLSEMKPSTVAWDWPRGVLLYAHRTVIETVGGMVEAFGAGGHEHVEWSQRIHANGLTPSPFISPRLYAERGLSGRPATRADALWNCADMRAKGESQAAFGVRKAAQTTISRTREDWNRIESVMEAMEGSTDFVPFKSNANGRTSATLMTSLPSRGAEGDSGA